MHLGSILCHVARSLFQLLVRWINFMKFQTGIMFCRKLAHTDAQTYFLFIANMTDVRENLVFQFIYQYLFSCKQSKYFVVALRVAYASCFLIFITTRMQRNNLIKRHSTEGYQLNILSFWIREAWYQWDNYYNVLLISLMDAHLNVLLIVTIYNSSYLTNIINRTTLIKRQMDGCHWHAIVCIDLCFV